MAPATEAGPGGGVLVGERPAASAACNSRLAATRQHPQRVLGNRRGQLLTSDQSEVAARASGSLTGSSIGESRRATDGALDVFDKRLSPIPRRRAAAFSGQRRSIRANKPAGSGFAAFPRKLSAQRARRRSRPAARTRRAGGEASAMARPSRVYAADAGRRGLLSKAATKSPLQVVHRCHRLLVTDHPEKRHLPCRSASIRAPPPLPMPGARPTERRATAATGDPRAGRKDRVSSKAQRAAARLRGPPAKGVDAGQTSLAECLATRTIAADALLPGTRRWPS